MTKKFKFKFKLPSSFIIIFGIIVILVMMTWIPGMSKKELGILDIFILPFKGLKSNIGLVGFILAIGAFLNIVVKSQALESGLQKLVKRMKGREIWLIPICMTLFSIGGTTYGMAEETIPFYLILIPIFMGVGFDPLTGFLVIMLGAGAGTLSSTINPFKIIVAFDTSIKSGVTGISNSTGLVWRIITWVIITGVFEAFVIWRALRIRKNPEKSTVFHRKEELQKKFNIQAKDIPLTRKRKAVLWIFSLTFFWMIITLVAWHKFGVTIFQSLNNLVHKNTPFITSMFPPIGDWYLVELSALFLIASIVIALIHWKGSDEFIGKWIDGAKDLLSVALIIALSGGVAVALKESGMGSIIVKYLAESLTNFNSILFVCIMLFVFIILSFFIPSSSALAKAAFPIVAPIAFSLGVLPSTIQAYGFASGFINLISPTSGLFMAILMITSIKWNEYAKTVLPFFGIVLLICIPLLIIGTQVPW